MLDAAYTCSCFRGSVDDMSTFQWSHLVILQGHEIVVDVLHASVFFHPCLELLMVQHLSAVLQHKSVSEMWLKWGGWAWLICVQLLVQWPGLHLIMSVHPIATPPSQPYWRRSKGFLSDLPLLCVLRRRGDRMRGIPVKKRLRLSPFQRIGLTECFHSNLA